MKRKIVSIDEEKCNGCGMCIPNCAEGAIKVIDGKAKLVDDRFCDGLGACLGHCPQDAIMVIERDAPEFDEQAVKKHLNVIKKPQMAPHSMPHACPGSMAMDFRGERKTSAGASARQNSELRQWPVQFMLVSPEAPYFRNAELLVAADCVPFAYPDFHSDFLARKSLVIGCPKLDDAEFYQYLRRVVRTLIESSKCTFISDYCRRGYTTERRPDVLPACTPLLLG